MELWYLLVIVPFVQIVRALVEAWHLLLEAGNEAERQEILANSGAKAFINFALAVLIAVAPWPYNLLGLVPVVFPALATGLASVFGVTLYWKYHGRL